MKQAMINLLIFINLCILCYFIFSLISYTILLISSFPEIIASYKLSKYTNIYSIINKKHLPPVTVLIPAYKAEQTLANAVWSALKSEYPNLYVIVILDGDPDGTTFNMLTEIFKFQQIELINEEPIKTEKITRGYISKTHSHLMLIEKEHFGVGDALNVGLNLCFTPYVMTMDADSVMEPDAISEMIHYMLSHEHTIAVGGGVYLLNDCKVYEGQIVEANLPKKLISALQINEYMRSHLFNRTAWNRLGGTMSYSGTATLFQRQALLNVNGFDASNFSQDAEVIIKLHEYYRRQKIDYRIGFTPKAAVWTMIPNNIKSYSIQQNHWRRGLLRSTLRYWYMFLNPRYKIQGLISYPFYMLLEILAPYVEFTAYVCVFIAYYIGILNGYTALLYIILAWGFSSYLSLACAFINLITFNKYRKLNDILKIFGLSLIDMAGFRQYLTTVKVWASFQYLINRILGKPQ
ncbi:TPA: glycosyltransferase family 2 protein [Legionella pneumophila]|nr:glycosyltransferase family 2 protein [Legionella pneumophila]HDV5732777.1 glycosyltransferase family 2 protein [Legionella pneumophila]HDV5751151.1 glycosyltransferase family 2 protein [Legionella pneumophila]